ncbi:DNA replication protein [Bacillus phage vB_BthS_BMBphi]|nr:DNA replication protein [Bacillus phage vB_BthS_BMBphi]
MKNCNLRSSCDKADTCKAPCQAFIALHGLNNSGGKQHDCLIPSEYRQTTFETARSKGTQSNTYGQLASYIKTFKKAFNEERNSKETRLKDLFFYSKETGTGKTETATMLANEFLTYSYMRSIMLDDPSSFQNPVYFLDMPQLQGLYLKANRGGTPQDIREDASREYYKRLSKAKKARLVVFDEMGLRDVSDAFRGDIHDLINIRTVENLTSVYTSNVPLKEMLDIYDSRLYDRIRRYCIEYNFIGESKRGIM